MELKNVILFVVIIVLFIIIFNYISNDIHTLSGLVEATALQKIDASDLDTTNANSSNFTYSIWFYIDDWNYRYGEPKVIFGRMTEGNKIKEPCPTVVLGANQNNIAVSLAVYPGSDKKPTKDSKYSIDSFSVANIPIQKWVNLLISVYGRTMDIYIDGKLVRTCILSGVAAVNNVAPIYITPQGGFSGWTANFQYWSNSTDPQQAWNNYKKGYGSSTLGGLFGRYAVKVSLIEGDVEESSFTI